MKGTKNSYDFGARLYDPRVGRWLSIDLAFRQYPESSPYNFGINSVIQFKDRDGNLVVDPDGNVVFIKLGEMKQGHRGAPGKTWELNFGYVIANDGTLIPAYQDVKKQMAGANTDCHGVTFAKGHVWIDNAQVPQLLLSDGYSEVNYDERKWGDAVIYTDEGGNIEDSRKVCQDHDIVYGQGGLQVGNTREHIDEAWSDPKETKIARIFHGYRETEMTETEINTLEKNILEDKDNLKKFMQTVEEQKPYLAPSKKENHTVPANPSPKPRPKPEPIR